MDRGPFVIQEKPGSDVTLYADFRDISPRYFETMRIPLLQGRDFAESDDAKHPQVIMIDQTLAREYFGIENPLGKHVVLPFGSPHSTGGCRSCRASARLFAERDA